MAYREFYTLKEIIYRLHKDIKMLAQEPKWETNSISTAGGKGSDGEQIN